MYYRELNDFSTVNSGALRYVGNNRLAGSAVLDHNTYRNTYYRDTMLQEEDSDSGNLIIVTEDNIDKYKYLIADSEGNIPEKYTEYLKRYYQFFLVGRSDEFVRLVSYCKENELETFVVVLYDDVENVVIENSCFGNTQKHPFRGIFDGNGFSIYISRISLTEEYACGIFGYIAENAVVKNLKVFAQPTDVSKYRIADYINNITVTVNNSEQLISLKSIKNGCNDVCIGVLAGVNQGTIENVIVSADISYASKIRPDVYLIQNKANELEDTNKKLIASNIINANIVDSFDNTTALSAFDNFCYPTQLCLNSSANMIPYVGYFNEGAFNTCTVDPALTKYPLYRYQTSGQYGAKAWWHEDRNISPGEGHDIEQFESNCSYMHDIFSYYVNTKRAESEADKYYRSENFGLVGITNSVYPDPDDGDSYVVPETAKVPMSFRLGPNSRQAFLIGGVVGYNNGDMTHVAAVEKLQFDKNIVALIGGIAGRGNRGKLTDVHARVVYSGSSGMYDDYIIVNNNAPSDAVSYMTCKMSALNELAFSSGSMTYTGTAGQTYEIATTVHLPVFTAGIITFSGETAPYGMLYSRESTAAEYDKYFDFYGTMDNENASIFAPVFSLTASNAGGSSAMNARITAASFVGDCHMCVKTPGAATAFLLQTSNLYSACSADDQGMPILLTDPDVSGTEMITYNPVQLCLKCSANYQNEHRDVEFVVPYSSFAGGFSCNVARLMENIGNFYQYSKDIKVNLPPVFNIGGMFGEYLYANGQSINDSSVYAGFKGFLPSGDINVSAKNSMTHTNKLASFACNLTIDSVNKSDSNLYRADQELASAENVIRNDLQCKVITLLPDAEEDAVNYNKWCTDDTTLSYLNDASASFAYYLNCYNQIAPALISTHYGDNLHRKGETHFAILGIQYEDQLFYKYGLNMGDIYVSNIGSPADYARLLASTNSENSGVYFNYPAQLSSYDHAVGSPYNADMCNFYTVVTAAYNITGGTQANITPSVSYISDQISYYPQHYPLYRGKATLSYYTRQLTFATSAYLRVNYNINTSAVHASAMADVADVVSNIIDREKPSSTLQNYIYAYSAEPLLKHVMPVECEMFYRDSYMTSEYAKTVPSTVSLGSLDEIAKLSNDVRSQYSNKAFAISSNSYMDVYFDNPASFVDLAKVTGCNIGAPASMEPNAIRPAGGSFITVSGCNITTGKHRILTTPFEIQEGVTQQTIGEMIRYGKLPTVSDLQIVFSHFYRILRDLTTDTLTAAKYDSKAKLMYNNNTSKIYASKILIDESKYEFKDGAGEIDYTHDYECVDDIMYCTFGVSYLSSYFDDQGIEHTVRVGENDTDLEKYLMSAKIIPSVPDTNIHKFVDNDGDVLSSHMIVFGYIPPEDNIVHALDRSMYTTVNCTGISANDIQYMLIYDERQRPIMDVKLDTTAVDNAGYIVKFDGIGFLDAEVKALPPTIETNFTQFGGLGINIENGNK